MALTTNPNPCTYLRSSTPYVFASERAELAHINEQIGSVDQHISELNTLRYALHRRSCQLHNLLAPVNNLPVEVLSYIFQQVILAVEPDFAKELILYDIYEQCLDHALVLSSVSTHFRRVAFGTQKLWYRVPLHIPRNDGIDKSLSLLHHCTALAFDVHVAVYDERVKEEAGPASIEALLTSDDMQKVTVFELSRSDYATDHWMKQLANSSFPLLNYLSLCQEGGDTVGVDLRNLSALTRLDLQGSQLGHPIFAPSSVEHLHIFYVSQSTVVSLLYQCPNIVRCYAEVDRDDEDDDFNTAENLNPSTLFTQPLTLTYLKELNFHNINGLEISSPMEKLCLPSLEYLHFAHFEWREFTGVVSLCRSASATLVTLVMDLPRDASDFAELYQLFRLPLPKLRQLKVKACSWSSFPSVIRVLALMDSERRNAKLPYLPSLNTVKLRCYDKVKPRDFLDVLKARRIGLTFWFHVRFKFYQLSDQDWTPRLRKRLASIVGKRRVKVRWDKHQVL